MAKREIRLLIVIVLITAVAAWVVWPGNPGIHLRIGSKTIDRDIRIYQGLDLQGGMQVLLAADIPDDQTLEASDMEAAKSIVERRVNGLGVTEPVVQSVGSRRILVELPGISDPQQAIDTLQQTGLMEWVDGNLGSGVTMKYPAVLLRGPRARGEVLSIAFAGDGQHYDAGAKAIHLAPHTSSMITSKSISKGDGHSGFRGLVRIARGAEGAQSKVVCDALLLDPASRSDTYPYIDVNEDNAKVEHEATVSKISEDQLFYLMSRGLTEQQASAIIINGFLEPFVKELPMEYAVELNRLVQLQMEGSVG